MKLANPNPSFCSSCFEQKPDAIHVDMESAWDGPVIDPGNGIKQVIDDLYVCRDCLISAYELLDEEGYQSHIQALEEEIVYLRERNALMADRLNKARDLVTPT